MQEGVRDGAPRLFDHASDGLSRDAQTGCSLLLAQSLEVHQPHGLQFVEAENHLVQVAGADPDRLEGERSRHAGHEAPARGAAH